MRAPSATPAPFARRSFLGVLTLVLPLALLAACGGGGGAGSAGGSALAGRLVLSGGALARARSAAASLHEVEPNDGALAPQDLGSLRPDEGVVVAGRLGSAADDPLDTLRLHLPERAEVAATLTLAGRDDDGDLAAFDPTRLACLGSARAESGRAELVVTAEGLLDLALRAVSGPCSWTLAVEVRAAGAGAPAAAPVAEPWSRPAGPADDYARVGARIRAGEALVLPRAGRDGEAEAALAAAGWRVLDRIPDGAWRVGCEPAPDLDAEARARETLARLLALSAHEAFERVEPNHRRRMLRVPNDPRYGEQWAYPLLRLPEAWDVTTGSASVIVAVIDTGITAHPDLAGRSVAGYDFISDPANANDGDGRDADPTDPGDGSGGEPASWHGTHVAGTVGAATNNGTGVSGVTWGCPLMALRVLGTEGGDDYDIANAILFAARLANVSGRLPAQRASVINMSLGGGDANATLADAIARARAAGVVIVAAAGNEATSQRSYPAAFDGVIAVGAVGRTGTLASYSNTGSWVDCVAPGGDSTSSAADGVLSTVRNAAGTGYAYDFYDGTSMASPHVAGVAALVLSVAPGLTPDGVEGILMTTARDLGAAGRDTTYGNGLIDAYAAVVRAQSGGTAPPVPPAPPPGPTPTPAGETLYVLAVDADSGDTKAEALVAPEGDLTWRIEGLAAGTYLLYAGTDRDGDGFIGDAGDLYGAWPDASAPAPIALDGSGPRDGLVVTLLTQATASHRTARARR